MRHTAGLVIRILSIWLLAVSFSICQSAFGEPTVQALQFVSGVKSGRTTCDLSFRLLVHGDTKGYRAAAFTAAPNNRRVIGLPSNTVSIAEIDAERILVTNKTLVARVKTRSLLRFKQNGRWVKPTRKYVNANWCRKDAKKVAVIAQSASKTGAKKKFKFSTPPLVASDFVFTFSGQPAGISTGPSGIHVGELLFLEGGGRPGHEGTFPIQGSSPPTGALAPLLVQIYGEVTAAAFQLLDANGQPIQQVDANGKTISGGTLTNVPSGTNTSSSFATTIKVPSQPFRVSVLVDGSQGDTLTWQSMLFTPAPLALQIQPSTATPSPGQSIPITLHIASDAINGDYTLNLLLPPEFTVSGGPWNVSVKAGSASDIATFIKVDKGAQRFNRYTTVIEAIPSQPALPTVTSTFDFVVE